MKHDGSFSGSTVFRLPRFIVIRSNHFKTKGNFYYRESDGSVVLGEPSVFSTLVKIVVERAKSNDMYIHLRFSHSNRYWQQKANDWFIVCVSTKPDEDMSKPSCTLFESVVVPNSNGMFYLTHVQSGGRLLIDNTGNNPTMSFYVNMNPLSHQGYLTVVNWESLVKLPERVAFKGYNGRFLEGVVVEGYNYLQFSSTDPNARSSGHEVAQMPDGYVRIKSDRFGKFWRLEPNWVWDDSSETTAANKNTVFWTVKIDANTIALRNAGNNNFCKHFTAEGKTNCLNAGVDTMTTEARLGVKEQVLERTLYNVRYRMDDARVFNEKPYLAGSTTLTNNEDVDASISVAIAYAKESSYSFSRSSSLTAGVATTITFGLPMITEMAIEISFEVNTTLEWERTTTTKELATATGTVPVKAKSSAVISYVGTIGTCNIPFYYTQQDRSSTDGTIMVSDRVDGIYTGVNCYNFHFVVDKTERLGA